MKAIRIHSRGGPEVMTFEEVETPAPRAGEVLIKVAAAGVNHADIGQRNGNYPNLVPLPAILGYEVAGTVVATGARTGDRAIPEGARVVSHVEGGYAEYAIADAAEVILLPNDVDFPRATAVPIQGQTAYLLLTEAARLRHGESVLVHAAAGGVGTLAVQLARLLGAGMVIGTARTPEELDLIRSLGADVAVNVQEPGWVGQVQGATRGRGVDIVLESIGGPIGQGSMACLAPFGRMVVFGALSAEMTPLVSQQLIRGCNSVIGFNTPLQPVEKKVEASRQLLGYIADGRLQTFVHAYPLQEAQAVHGMIEAGRTTGKFVLTL